MLDLMDEEGQVTSHDMPSHLLFSCCGFGVVELSHGQFCSFLWEIEGQLL